MSFDHYARKVRDADRPPWARLCSLRGCVSSYCWLSRQPYRATLERLGLAWTPDVRREPPSDAFLRATMDALERERNRCLDELRAFERRRIRAKLRGNRQLSRAEREALARLRDPAPEPAATPWR